MKLFAPAKLNLFLNVLSKRPDGYHDLETLFERIDLCDEIVLTPQQSGVILETSSSVIPKGPANLAVKAALLLQREAHTQKGVRIRLQKRIPVAAGLGGGSSDAASVLLGLNRLWKLRLSRKRLLRLAARLGSDVPFFVLDTSWALARGRGEKLRPVPLAGTRLWHVVVKPPFGISTKQAYQALKPPFLTLPKRGVKMLLRSLQKGDFKPLSKLLTNSLEATRNKRVTNISKIKKKLVLEGASAALMSGSGSAVFGLFQNKKEASHAARKLGKKNRSWKVFVASTY